MTQVYTSYLKNEFPQNIVEAWVYAGPTAGDKVFARGLTSQLDAYFAFNNSLDVIPHSWQVSTLNELCTIYNNLAFCDTHTFNNNPVIEAFASYSKSLSSHATFAYTIPGNPHEFEGSTTDNAIVDCGWFYLFFYLGVWQDPETNYLQSYPIEINNNCDGSSTLTFQEFYGFYAFLAEMGYQHTTAYAKHFFDPNQYTAVNNYSPGATSFSGIFTEGTDGKDILEEFMKNIIDANITDCGCGN